MISLVNMIITLLSSFISYILIVYYAQGIMPWINGLYGYDIELQEFTKYTGDKT